MGPMPLEANFHGVDLGQFPFYTVEASKAVLSRSKYFGTVHGQFAGPLAMREAAMIPMSSQLSSIAEYHEQELNDDDDDAAVAERPPFPVTVATMDWKKQNCSDFSTKPSSINFNWEVCCIRSFRPTLLAVAASIVPTADMLGAAVDEWYI